MWINMRYFREMTAQFLGSCQTFYALSKNSPGELILSVGLKNALCVKMYDEQSRQKSDSEFPDLEYRADLVLRTQEIGSRMPEIEEMYNDIIFAFNANALAME